MNDEEHDYMGWAKTGHLTLTLGLVFGVYSLLGLVLAVDARATGAIVVYAFLLLCALNAFVLGARQRRARRSQRSA